MPRYTRYLLVIGVLLPITNTTVSAQSTFAQPYSSQLRTDPGVGNVQGIQRYGRPLKTDPDQGSGFSYHVYPVADSDAPVRVAVAPRDTESIRRLESHARELKEQAEQEAPERRPELMTQYNIVNNQLAIERLRAEASFGTPYVGRGIPGVPVVPPIGPYGFAFDSTSGLRNYQTPLGTPEALQDPFAAAAIAEAQAFGLTDKGAELLEIYHQPLIQIKLRVIEVSRNDALQVNSVLEYVSRSDAIQSLTSGEPLNNDGTNGFENARAASNFEIQDLIDAIDNGSGGLVNLTGEHINWAISFLASEFNGDVITAPEVVTLNGQNVEFIAGEKLPFQLGQNVIQGTNNNIQQVFYKNVGTYVSVTPKIVNWGFHGEGQGEAVLVASDVKDWNGLIKFMLDEETMDLSDAFRRDISVYEDNDRVVPFAVKESILKHLSHFSKQKLVTCEKHNEMGQLVLVPRNWVAEEVVMECQGRGCQEWKPENCTIDLALVVRLSEQGTEKIDFTTGPDSLTIDTSTEQNVRAIANVIQITSGEGVVMAGLIGEREEEVVSKIPILGDLPYVGFPFRSKSTLRQKTELLIFLEATVLDRRPEVAKAQSAHDFQLGRAYVEGELLDNPLECGMYRAGFGTYLPPIRPGEEQYWLRHHRKVRKVATHLDDIRE